MHLHAHVHTRTRIKYIIIKIQNNKIITTQYKQNNKKRIYFNSKTLLRCKTINYTKKVFHALRNKINTIIRNPITHKQQNKNTKNESFNFFHIFQKAFFPHFHFFFFEFSISNFLFFGKERLHHILSHTLHPSPSPLFGAYVLESQRVTLKNKIFKRTYKKVILMR